MYFLTEDPVDSGIERAVLINPHCARELFEDNWWPLPPELADNDDERVREQVFIERNSVIEYLKNWATQWPPEAPSPSSGTTMKKDPEEGSSAETGGANKPAGSTQRPSDIEILETIRAVNHRCTTMKLLTEMTLRKLSPSPSTVKKRLAALVKAKQLNNDPKANPRGYGLPEWNSGSSGSSSSSGS
jgi:hypothetical protein